MQEVRKFLEQPPPKDPKVEAAMLRARLRALVYEYGA